MEGSGIRDSFYFSRISYNALNHDVELRLVNRRTIAAEVCRNTLKLKKMEGSKLFKRNLSQL